METKMSAIGSSSETLAGAGDTNYIDLSEAPFTPFFIDSPDFVFSFVDCLENMSLPERQNNGEQPPAGIEPVTVVTTHNNLSSQQTPCLNLWELECLDNYDELFDWEPENNDDSELQQQLEISFKLCAELNLAKESTEQREQLPVSHTAPISQEGPQPNNPIMMENNQQAGQINEPGEAFMNNFDELNGFEFPINLQGEQHCPLVQQMNQPTQFTPVYDQLVHNFSNSNPCQDNGQAVPNLDLVSQNPTQARVNGNIQMQHPQPLCMPPSSTGGPWISNQHQSSFQQIPAMINNPGRHNPMPPNSLRPNRTQNYPPHSMHLHNSSSSPNIYGQQQVSPLGTRPTLLRPLQPHHFNELPYASAFVDPEEPLALRMARASVWMRSLNSQQGPDSVLAPRTYTLLNQPPRPTMTSPLQDLSLPPRPQSFLSSNRLQGTQGLMNQSSRAIPPYLGLDNQQQGSYMNSTTQEIGGHLNGQSSTSPFPIGTSTTNYKGKGILGQRSHGELSEPGQPSEHGQPAENGQPPKRPKGRKKKTKQTSDVKKTKKTLFGQEESSRSQSTRNLLSQEMPCPIVKNPFDLRPANNSVYDPIFEGVGLPVDPHLRLFGIS